MAIALIFGATGAVGSNVLKEVLQSKLYSKVVVIGRRQLNYDDVGKEKLEQKVVDFDNLEKSKDDFRSVDTVFCCLGTTAKDAGSAENFIKIDHDYVINSAKIVHEQNKHNDGKSKVHFIYCSSRGANASSLFLYPRSKGLTEQHLSEIGFKNLSIFRPALLQRPNPRLLEKIFLPLAKLASPIVLTWIPSSTVAKSMLRCAEKILGGSSEPASFEIIENRQIYETAT